jgi:hypothetical protein
VKSVQNCEEEEVLYGQLKSPIKPLFIGQLKSENSDGRKAETGFISVAKDGRMGKERRRVFEGGF